MFLYGKFIGKIKKKLFSEKYKTSTTHIATLQTGILGFIEVPITTMKPLLHRIKDKIH